MAAKVVGQNLNADAATCFCQPVAHVKLLCIIAYSLSVRVLDFNPRQSCKVGILMSYINIFSTLLPCQILFFTFMII